jgi:hypothetical protein
MNINDIYDEWYITDYIFGYKDSELDFIQDDDNINMNYNNIQLMENNEINDDNPSLSLSLSLSPSLSPRLSLSPSPSPQLMEKCEINKKISSLRLIKTVWPIKILNLNTRELNNYIKKNNLTYIKIQQLKKERRRLNNRIYARASREKKKKV